MWRLIFKSKRRLIAENNSSSKRFKTVVKEYDKLVDEYGSAVISEMSKNTKIGYLNKTIKTLQEENGRLRKDLINAEEKLLLLLETNHSYKEFRKLRIQNLIDSCGEDKEDKKYRESPK